MSRSKTVGFAIADTDTARLDHLVGVFSNGNRSLFLRVAMTEMERIERAQRLQRLQAYGSERADTVGAPADAVAAVQQVLKSRV